MTPMGFAIHRQARLHSAVMDDDDMYGDDWDPAFDHPSRVRPVPIWLCVFLVVSYIIAGAFLFSQWENWSFLDSAYFCFITLTTIGERSANFKHYFCFYIYKLIVFFCAIVC